MKHSLIDHDAIEQCAKEAGVDADLCMRLLDMTLQAHDSLQSHDSLNTREGRNAYKAGIDRLITEHMGAGTRGQFERRAVMKIKFTTWRSLVAQYGDYEARRRLRWLQREWAFIKEKRDPFSLIYDLVHLWPGRSPTENRKKFAVPIRGLLREIRRRREHTNALCAPGMSLQRLP